MTESNAILRHIGRKHGLDGKTEEEKVKVDMLEGLSYNFHVDFARICYSPDFVRLKQVFRFSLCLSLSLSLSLSLFL
jgi:glutathione S-transferase